MNSKSPPPPPLDDDAIGRLIEHAGPPHAPAPEHEAAIRSAVHAQWQQVVAARRRARHRWIALAATVVMSAATFIGWQIVAHQLRDPIMQVATLAENAPGIVIRRVETQTTANPSAAIALYSGDVLETAAQGVRVQLLSGAALRIAPHSALRLQNLQLVALLHGALYFEGHGHETPLTVSTTFGTVEHVGTRYLAQLTRDSLIVRVRDGAVHVDAGDRRISVAAREQISLDRDGHAVRDSLSSAADAWEWADRLAPMIVIENRRLDAFLEWVAHETGREVSYADASAQRAAHDTILHGSVEHLTPSEALDVILTTTDFDRAVEGERLVVKRR